jgi:hypothetical protein
MCDWFGLKLTIAKYDWSDGVAINVARASLEGNSVTL